MAIISFKVVKNRYSGDLGIMTLEFNKKALSYAQKKPKEKAIQVSESEETG